MTRKDYEKFAAMFRDRRETNLRLAHGVRLHAMNDATTMLMHDIADIFQRDNPRFDRERFVNACSLP